ncbi:oligosaccharyl transferase, archaeosortase A system-associated [Halopiger xanaduensis]|uniref:dolichyl-phosphooligosaccharide-protein glycotransferase n=1 Tax=Halopiger xanaduensis (strain DSM 18323 / JCM 14033 / SH-6) TaxID=797210 RepID=F8D8C4_HALXS|nr:oligosaccharyl transferase, archaeosortase A system-associated [Halopiger xanaduensis]AEH36962.1 Oligosaccharyl transferase STT3 subunit [Halopiger xanaduensis SH-6]
MSTDTEHVEEESDTSSALATWRNWYHFPIIGAVMLFMFWLRTQSFDRFTTGDGTPALAGIDSWYHWRTIQWTAENYPHTMPYEIWTGFPEGNYVGQFGTLFDQLIVTAAMIVGLGDPSAQTLYTVSLLSIPLMAALVAIPVFYMGRRLGGTLGGIISIIILALSRGQFLSRSTVGQLDHHVGEALFMAIAVLAMMVALTVGEREKPIYELIADKDWQPLRTPALYSVLAGLALSLYIWVWPSGVVLVGIFGAFFAVQLCLDYLRGVSPDHIAFVGAVSLGVTTLVTAILIERPGFGTTNFSYLQPLLALSVAVGCLFMAWLAREWNNRSIDRRYYPAAVVGIGAGALALIWLVLPDLYSTLVGNLTGRLLPVGASESALTVQEVQPPDNYFNHVFSESGSAFYTMLIGLVFLAIRPLFGRKFRAEHTLVIVWSLFLISMAAAQVRFSYYLVLAIAVVNAAFVAEVVRLFDLDLTKRLESVRQLETYQVLTVVIVVLLLFAPLLPPIATATAWGSAESVGPNSDAMTWEEANHWLEGNTPEPGDWADANNTDELEYYGTYEYPEDGDYDYPKGSYGVISWWDYGHLITTQGERIPHSNPFQQNARSSSAFLTATSEERAELILDAIAAGESPTDESNEQLEQLAADTNDSGEDVRYVMIDDQMAGGKFSAMTAFTGPGYSNYYDTKEYEFNGEQQQVAGPNENYYNTTTASLYLQDANEMEHYRLVHENDDYAVVGGMQRGQQLLPHYSIPLEMGWSNQTAAIQANLADARENDEIDQSLGIPVWDAHLTSTVKTFERVEGATITGTVDDQSIVENATVTAAVELETDPGRTFTYEQEASVNEDGSFELTVPYATNDELSVEDGYTNSSVEALSDYVVSVEQPGEQDLGVTEYQGQTEVTESAIVDGETVSVDLEEVELEDPTDGNSSNESGSNGTNGDSTDDTEENNSADNEPASSVDSVAPIATEPAV